MKRRDWIIALLTVALLGCATERPTRPSHGSTPMPAFPLSKEAIQFKSEPITPTIVNDSEFVFYVGGEIGPTPEPQTDIEFQFAMSEGMPRVNAYAWHISLRKWEPIQLRPPGVWTIGKSDGRAFLSATGFPLSAFVDPSSFSIKLLTVEMIDPTIRVLTWADGYEFIPVHTRSEPFAATWENGHLWVATRYWQYSGIYADSLIAYDSAGTHVKSTPLPFVPFAIAWSQDGLWAMHSSQPIVFALCDSNGSVIDEFHAEGYVDGVRGMYVRNGELWINQHYKQRVVRIDVEKSLQEDTMVIADSTFLSSVSGNTRVVSANSGLIVLASSSVVNVFAVNGTLLKSLETRFPIHAGAYDGEALWLIHERRIVVDTLSRGKVISRFTVE